MGGHEMMSGYVHVWKLFDQENNPVSRAKKRAESKEMV